MTHFLSTGLSIEVTLDAKKRLAVRSGNFGLFTSTLYHKGSDDIWRCAGRQLEKDAVLCEAHHDIVGGHYAGDATARKIWQSGLWWPTTKKDAHEFCKQCDLCQLMGQPNKQDRMPHKLILPLEPFQKWGLDFVGPFKPPATRTSNQYIIVVTNYCIKWVEEKALQDNTATSAAKFVNTFGVASDVPPSWSVTREVTLSTRRSINLRSTTFSFTRRAHHIIHRRMG